MASALPRNHANTGGGAATCLETRPGWLEKLWIIESGWHDEIWHQCTPCWNSDHDDVEDNDDSEADYDDEDGDDDDYDYANDEEKGYTVDDDDDDDARIYVWHTTFVRSGTSTLRLLMLKTIIYRNVFRSVYIIPFVYKHIEPVCT